MSAFQTMGHASKDRVEVRGFDLCEELIGSTSLTEMFFLEVIGRRATDQERVILDAVLVALTEHGLTPSALATRLTDLGSPGAMHGAVAAGLLGAGDRFLGALYGCARILQEWPEDADGSEYAQALVAATRQRGERLPGLGHPTHIDCDPRTVALFALAADAGLSTRMRRRLEELQRLAEAASSRTLPINVDGAAAVLLSEIGMPWQTTRGVALVARTAGLVGHLFDELRNPVAQIAWQQVDGLVPYRAPATSAGPAHTDA